MKLLALTSEAADAPSFRVRTVLPARALEHHDVGLIHRSLFSASQSRRFGSGGPGAKAAVALEAHRGARRNLASELATVDGALVHRRVDPLPSLLLERRVRRTGRLVYDVDDAIWLDTTPGGRSHPLAALRRSARKVRWLARHADHVIAGNAILAEHLARYAATVSVVPSVVDTERIEVRTHAESPELVLGWIGSRSTAPFVAGVSDVVSRVARELGGVELRLLMVGGSVPPPAGLRYEAREWSPAAESDALRRMDVGMMPLTDVPWNRGKCAYKAIQYMAAGVPVVADDVGIAADVVDHGRAGYAVRDGEEWVEALLALLRDRALRERLGREGRIRAERDYSLMRWAPELAVILRG